MPIDWSDSVDEPGDAHMNRRGRSTPDNSDGADTDGAATVSEGNHPNSSRADLDAASRTEQAAAYRSKVDAVYRLHAIDQANARVEKVDRQTISIKAEDPGPHPVNPDDRPESANRLADADGLVKLETPRIPGGDVPDDPRNYSNPKTGRVDASWSAYDRAIAAAREHSGGDLGADAIKMYDHNHESGEGTGTLIGEQTADRLRGWRIDGRDGHVNWWDWTGGKKGAGGAYGHDWFPEDPSVPGSRYIGWAPWQDSDGNILEGN